MRENDSDNEDKYKDPYTWGSKGSLSLQMNLSKSELSIFKYPNGTIKSVDSIRVKYTINNIGNEKLRFLWNFSDYHDTIFEVRNKEGDRLKRLRNPWSNGPVLNKDLRTLEPESNHTLGISIQNSYYDFEINRTYTIRGVYKVKAEEYGGYDGTEKLFPYWSGEIYSDVYEVKIV